MYKHILIATDGSKLAQRAVDDGIDLAKALGADVTAMTVMLPYRIVAPGEVLIAFPEAEYLKQAEAEAEKTVAAVKNTATMAGVVCKTRRVIEEHPWKAIAEAAERDGCDLIVMGSHGRSGITKLILGSETQKVVSHSKVPVLVHR